jgi:GNAT superfamily N-acetyltransferase
MTTSISARAIYNTWNVAARKFPDKIKVFNEKGILAYNTPTDDPYLNWVWAKEITSNLVNKIDRFYRGKSYCWFINKDNQVMVENAIKSGLVETYSFYEYVMELDDYSIKQEEINRFKIKTIQDHEHLKTWCRVFSEGYGTYNQDYYYNSQKYLFESKFPYTVLGYVNEKPVVTGQLFISGGYACITAITTLKEERSKGYARAINYHLLNYAKEEGCNMLSLNSLHNAQGFYQNLGFKLYSKDYGYVHIKYII